jgi:hypothetical protein
MLVSGLYRIPTGVSLAVISSILTVCVAESLHVPADRRREEPVAEP